MTLPLADNESEPTRLDADGANALARALGLLGDEWTLLILRSAMWGSTRYQDFADALPISNAVLTNRLDVLVRESLMERKVYQQHPVRSQYVLTQRGRSTWPLLVAMWAWEGTWVPVAERATPPMRHRICGRDMTPRYCCSHCSRPAPATSLETMWGPSGGWRRSVPEIRTRRRAGTRHDDGSPGVAPFAHGTMAVFGNRWSSSVVGAAFRGVARFKDFQELLGAPPSLLAERLSSLCDHGILRQEKVPGRSDWTEYKLTPKGLDFFPVIGVAVEWANNWYTHDEGPVIIWTHLECGAPFRGVLTCDRCDVALRGADIVLGDAA